MDCTALLLLLLLPCFVWFWCNLFIHGSTDRKLFKPRLPPGPRRLPFIGNLLELGDKPHQSVTALSKRYGPVMYLKLGSINTIVVSSSEAAQEVLKEKDEAFSSRTVLKGVQVADHPEFSVVFLPASAHWLKLRRICRMQIFSPQRVDAYQGVRRKVVAQLLDHARKSCSSGQAIDVGRAAFTTTLNLLSNTLFSVNLAHHDSDSSQEFKDLIWSIMEEAGKPNLADFFTGLGWVDPQGIQRRMTAYFWKLAEVFDGFINQRLYLKAPSVDSDVLDSLLNLNKLHDHELSSDDIKHLLVVGIRSEGLSVSFEF